MAPANLSLNHITQLILKPFLRFLLSECRVQAISHHIFLCFEKVCTILYKISLARQQAFDQALRRENTYHGSLDGGTSRCLPMRTSSLCSSICSWHLLIKVWRKDAACSYLIKIVFFFQSKFTRTCPRRNERGDWRRILVSMQGAWQLTGDEGLYLPKW